MAHVGVGLGLLFKAAKQIWKGISFTVRDPDAAWREIQRFKWWGLCWDFRGFLGMSATGPGPIYVGCVQIFGENKSATIHRISGCIKSNISGAELPLTMEGMRPDETNGIPSGCRFFIQALFRDPNSAHEGFIEERFLEEWSDFTFIFTADKKQYEYRFRRREVGRRLDLFRKSIAPKQAPVITRRPPRNEF